MSKKSDMKEKLGYTDKAIPNTCSNCSRFRYDMELPKWMREHNADIEKGATMFGNYGKPYGDERKQMKNLRCSFANSNFAVKKMGTCNEHAKVAAV